MEGGGGNGNAFNAIVEAVIAVVNMVSTIVAGKAARDVAEAAVKQEELSKLPDWLVIQDGNYDKGQVITLAILVVVIALLIGGIIFISKQKES